MKNIFQLIEALPCSKEALEEDDPETYRCFECGNTKGFYEHKDWESGIVDEILCSVCDSPNTDWDGEGSPEHYYAENGTHECDLGWSCSLHKVFKCQECWKWKSWENDEEPEEYICNECE